MWYSVGLVGKKKRQCISKTIFGTDSPSQINHSHSRFYQIFKLGKDLDWAGWKNLGQPTGPTLSEWSHSGSLPYTFWFGHNKEASAPPQTQKNKKTKTKDKKNLHSLAKSRLSLVASPHLLHKPLVFWAQNPRSSLSGMRIRHVASTFCICDSGHSVSQQSGHVSYGLNFEKRVRNSGVSFWSKIVF
jgi:hypothetical protein